MAEKEKRKRSVFSRIVFWTLSAIPALSLLLSVISGFVNPEKAWYLTIFSLAFLPLSAVCALFAVMALLRRSSSLGLLVLALIPAALLFGRFWQKKSNPAPEDGSIKIVSYNVGLFSMGGGKTDREATTAAAMAFLRDQDADIVCLQEVFIPYKQDFEKYFRRFFPDYNIVYFTRMRGSGNAGNVTLSRYPVLSKGRLEFENSTNMAVYADVDMEGVPLRIYNCHLESYNITPSKFAKSVSDEVVLEENSKKMRHSILNRPSQVKAIENDMASCRYRSLVLGDFNDNPVSYTYTRLKRGRKDSFVEAGSGFGATYRSFRPFLRIDFILSPGDIVARTSRVLKADFSDHYPLVATYDLKK